MKFGHELLLVEQESPEDWRGSFIKYKQVTNLSPAIPTLSQPHACHFVCLAGPHGLGTVPCVLGAGTLRWWHDGGGFVLGIKGWADAGDFPCFQLKKLIKTIREEEGGPGSEQEQQFLNLLNAEVASVNRSAAPTTLSLHCGSGSFSCSATSRQ